MKYKIIALTSLISSLSFAQLAFADQNYTISGPEQEHCLVENAGTYLVRQCKDPTKPSILTVNQNKQIKFDNGCFEVKPNRETFAIEVHKADCKEQEVKQQFIIKEDNKIGYQDRCVTGDYFGKLIIDSCAASTFTVAPIENKDLISSGMGKFNIEDYAWLGYSTSATSYMPYSESKYGGRFIQDTYLMKNWTTTRISLPGRCSVGLEKSGELCYPQCKAGYHGTGPVCWENCPEGYTDDGAFCRKDNTHAKSSYGRGVGSIPPCPAGQDFDTGLCYPQCQTGYDGVGPVCWGRCEKGLVDTGGFCQDPNVKIITKKSYGRGVGKPVIISHYEPDYDEKACGNNDWRGVSHNSWIKQGFLTLRNDKEKVTVFAIRGTAGIENIISDIDFTPHLTKLAGKDVWLHSGFWRNTESISEDLKEALDITPKDHKIIIAGHSLGGSVATVAAVHFVEWGRKPDGVITLGSPLTGDSRFKDVYQSQVGCENTMRITTSGDIIPKIPEVYGYTHVCDPKEGTYDEDPLSNHDLFMGYKEAMVELFGVQAGGSNTACPDPKKPE